MYQALGVLYSLSKSVLLPKATLVSKFFSFFKLFLLSFFIDKSKLFFLIKSIKSLEHILFFCSPKASTKSKVCIPNWFGATT